jgi:hypothetical protein
MENKTRVNTLNVKVMNFHQNSSEKSQNYKNMSHFNPIVAFNNQSFTLSPSFIFKFLHFHPHHQPVYKQLHSMSVKVIVNVENEHKTTSNLSMSLSENKADGNA